MASKPTTVRAQLECLLLEKRSVPNNPFALLSAGMMAGSFPTPAEVMMNGFQRSPYDLREPEEESTARSPVHSPDTDPVFAEISLEALILSSRSPVISTLGTGQDTPTLFPVEEKIEEEQEVSPDLWQFVMADTVAEDPVQDEYLDEVETALGQSEASGTGGSSGYQADSPDSGASGSAGGSVSGSTQLSQSSLPQSPQSTDSNTDFSTFRFTGSSSTDGAQSDEKEGNPPLQSLVDEELSSGQSGTAPVQTRTSTDQFNRAAESNRQSETPQEISPSITPVLDQGFGSGPLPFELNRGQTDSQVEFLSRGKGYQFFLTSNEMVLTLNKQRAVSAQARLENPNLTGNRAQDVVRVKIEGGDAGVSLVGKEELKSRTNYFMGDGTDTSFVDIPNYARVHASSVYEGIDLVYQGNQGRLRFDFEARPGADISQIKLSYERESS